MGQVEPPEGFNQEPFDHNRFGLNTKPEIILEQMAANIKRHLPQVSVHPPQTTNLCIVGGGWSLDETLPELLELYWQNKPIMALNGAANWLMERNIKPGAVVVLDARPDNIDFIREPIPKARYFLASQCHPSLFDLCEDRDTYILHLTCSKAETIGPDSSPTEKREAPQTAILDAHYKNKWHSVIGGSTVGLRSLVLARMLGFEMLHLFGMDSCYAPDGKHHAYPQEMNDSEGSDVFWCAGREFRCSAWQASQAANFMTFISSKNGDFFNLSIHGDGLLAHMINTGAKLKDNKDDDEPSLKSKAQFRHFTNTVGKSKKLAAARGEAPDGHPHHWNLLDRDALKK